MWALKWITAPAYILAIVRIHGKPGWKWSFRIKDFCETWNIKRRTFFHAVSQLRTHGLLHWESAGKITVWYGSDIASSATGETVQSVAPAVQSIAPRVPSVAPAVQSIAPKISETLAAVESCKAPYSIHIDLKSSSNLIKEKEEDQKTEVKQEQEVDQVKSICQPPKELKFPIKRKLLKEDDPPAAKSLDEYEKIDVGFLKWMTEVKIPSLELDDEVRNVESFARGMIKRDGECLRREYAAVRAEEQLRKEGFELRGQVEARLEQWKEAEIPSDIRVYDSPGGRPVVLMDGKSIPAAEFLKQPIENVPTVATIPLDKETQAKRPDRQKQLRKADKDNECPGIDFLQQCWNDIFLRGQLKLILVKHSDWAVVDNDKLEPIVNRQL